MFNKKVEDKKYTSVYNSQANQSTNLKYPLNLSFNRDYRSASMSKVPATTNSLLKNNFLNSGAPSTNLSVPTNSSFNNRSLSKVPATTNSLLKTNFLNSGATSTNLSVPTNPSFNRDYRTSSMSKITGGTGSKSTTTNSITKNNFMSNDDKHRSYSSSSSTSINRTNFVTHTERSYEMKSESTFSPTFGPTTLFNSKYDNVRPSIVTPSFRAPILTTSVAGISNNIRTTPVVTHSVFNRPTATPFVSTREQMNHLPLKSFMKTNNKGYCVIFNHAKFKNPELNRAGTEHDEKALLKVFKKFNIKCEVKPDFTLAKIRSEIKCLTKKDFSKYACLIIVILSHGSKNEQLSAYDESYFLDTIITEPIFKNKTLAGKPKFFFIQACKGSSNSLVHTNIPQADSVDKKHTLAETNLMKCYSTYESRVAWRFSDTGSIFIKAFCEILNEDGDKKHIQDIMQAVGKKITSTEELAMQVPSVLSTMTANFYFCNLSFEE